MNNLEEELESQKCTGPNCPHYMLEDHYVVTKAFIDSALSSQKKLIVEALENLQDKQISSGEDESERLVYNSALLEAIKLIGDIK